VIPTIVEDTVVEELVSRTEAVRPIASQTTAIAIIALLEKRTARTMVIVKITLPTVAPKTVANAIPVITVTTTVNTAVTTTVGPRPSFIVKINKTARSISLVATHGNNAARILPIRRSHLAVASSLVIIKMTTLALKLVKLAAACCHTKVMTAAEATAAAALAPTTIMLAYLIVIVMPPLMIILEGTCTGKRPQSPLRNLQPRSLP